MAEGPPPDKHTWTQEREYLGEKKIPYNWSLLVERP